MSYFTLCVWFVFQNGSFTINPKGSILIWNPEWQSLLICIWLFTSTYCAVCPFDFSSNLTHKAIDLFLGSYESSYQLSPALHDEASYDHHPDTAHFPSHYPPFETHPCYVTEDMTSHCSDVNVNQYYHASYPPCNTTLPAFQTSFQAPYYDTPEIKSEDDSEFIDQSSFMCRKGKRGKF